MDSDKDYVIKEYDVHEYSYIKEYKGRKIRIDFCDLFYDDCRYTLFYCHKYFDGNMKLVNASNAQIINEVDNLFRIAVEIIDNKSLVKKIKGLFK